ncbi:MAG: hypothetical protein ACI3XM_05950, partial [Eubacteriales bacterium]
PATPGSKQSFGSGEKLDWIEEVIPYESYGDCPRIWDHLYAAIRTGVPHPVQLCEALDVIRVIDDVKADTIFELRS